VRLIEYNEFAGKGFALEYDMLAILSEEQVMSLRASVSCFTTIKVTSNRIRL
jgi:hypothetical protein